MQISHKVLFLLTLFLVPACEMPPGSVAGPAEPFDPKYPAADRDTNQIDTLFGAVVPDPYRWLESERSPQTAEWLAAQADLTNRFFQSAGNRSTLEKRLLEMEGFAQYGLPKQSGKDRYFLKKDGKHPSPALYRESGQGGHYQLVFAPDPYPLIDFSPSPDGRFIALFIADFIRIFDIATDRLLPDSLGSVDSPAAAWHEDGFFYGVRSQVMFHRLGTQAAEDQIVFADRTLTDRAYRPSIQVGSPWLLVEGDGLLACDLRSGERSFYPISPEPQAVFEPVGLIGNTLLARTTIRAPRGRLVRIPLDRPDPGFWEEIIPMQEEEVLDQATLAGGKILTVYQKNATHRLMVYSLDGRMEGEVLLPGLGSISGLLGEADSPAAFFRFENFLQPPTLYQLDVGALTSTAYRAPSVNFSVGQYQTRQIWVPADEDFQFPLFLIMPKNHTLSGNDPVLLVPVCSDGRTATPLFEPEWAVFLENGGIVAVANTRGSGIYGEDSHQAGSGMQKQQAIQDLAEAAAYLVGEGYTTADRIAFWGRKSDAGAIACLAVQRPDLFRCAAVEDPVADLIRFHLLPGGEFLKAEWGNPEKEKNFDRLLALSPLHQLDRSELPAFLIQTRGEVSPIHAYKLAAIFQFNQNRAYPVLLENNAEDFLSSRARAERLSFLMNQLDMPVIYRSFE